MNMNLNESKNDKQTNQIIKIYYRKVKKIKKNITNKIKYKSNNKDKINKFMENIFYIIFIILSFINLSEEIEITKLNLYSEITITIKGSQEQNILSNYYIGPNPNEIMINNNTKNYSDKIINLVDEINNITIRWESELTICSHMFHGLTNITNIDLSKFDISKVTDIENMFEGCESLTSLDLSIFNNTSNIKFMDNMFRDCISLQNINFTNFNTSNVLKMDYLFYNCSSLISLDLSNFDTSSVTNMEHMFSSCSTLISLDLKSFDTSLVTNMGDMFNGCKNLKFLNINSFNTNNVKNMENMFKNCNSLTS